MVALRVEGGRERQHVRGTELHAEAAGFAALHDNRNTSFCHENPQLRSNDRSEVLNYAGCDYAAEWVGPGVIDVTYLSEGKHERFPVTRLA
jgi:hypothetical protein